MVPIRDGQLDDPGQLPLGFKSGATLREISIFVKTDDTRHGRVGRRKEKGPSPSLRLSHGGDGREVQPGSSWEPSGDPCSSTPRALREENARGQGRALAREGRDPREARDRA